MTEWTTLDVARPLLIAEVGGNHEGDPDRALALAVAAAEAGADAVKFQTYAPQSLVNPRLAPDRYEHFGRFTLESDVWDALVAALAGRGVPFMTSLWDPSQVERFSAHVPAWKVGSGDLTNLALLDRLLGTGKPLILSTAMSGIEDVDLVMGFVRARAPELLERRALALLQCTAMYDEPREDETHLAAMATLRDRYGVVVGFSSHVPGIRAPAVAAAMGAQVLEVHVTDDRTRAFRDHRLSLTMEELAALRRELEALPVLRGSPEKRVLESERENRKSFRRGLYPTRDLPAGHVLRAEDLVALRPQVGLGAERYFDLLGRRLTRDVTALDPLAETDVGD